MKTTSKTILDQIIENGSLSRARLAVYQILWDQGTTNPITAEELRTIAKRQGHPNWVHFPKRLSELERMMAIVSTTPRKCRITGNEAVTWVVTGLLPINIRTKPSKTKRERKKEAMDYARSMWTNLRIESGQDKPERGNSFLKLLHLIQEI